MGTSADQGQYFAHLCLSTAFFIPWLLFPTWKISQGLAAWVNSYLTKYQHAPVTTLPDDLTDGVKLMQFLEARVRQKKEKQSESVDEKEEVPKYIESPKNRIQKIENASKALKYITENLHVKLVGIGAEGTLHFCSSLWSWMLTLLLISPDIVDGNLRLSKKFYKEMLKVYSQTFSSAWFTLEFFPCAQFGLFIQSPWWQSKRFEAWRWPP